MKNRNNHDTDQNDAKAGVHVEGLLRAAATFIPEHDVPDGIVSSALARSGSDTRGTALPSFKFIVSGVLVAACALAAATLILAHPSASRNNGIVARTRNRAPDISKIVFPVTKEKPLGLAQASVVSTQKHLPHPRHRRRLKHNAIAVTQPLSGRQRPAKTITLPPHHSIATNTSVAPVRSGWTTEEVQETNYMLVSPGVVTEGSGASERATPVMVSLPINPNGSDAGDAYRPEAPDPDAN